MRYLLLTLALAGVVPAAHAQGSIFSARGLGLPGRGVSAQSWGMSGATGLFDFQSAENPASLGRAQTMWVGFNLVAERRNVTTPAGDADTKAVQFPLFSVIGPIPSSPFRLGLTFSNYTSRDFELVTTHTETLRGVPVDVTDSLSSNGGINDLGIAASYVASSRLDVGLALHVLTGVNRVEQTRVFSDSAYLPADQAAELSYSGVGFAAGAVLRASSRLNLAALVRTDVNARVERDSAGPAHVDLPHTFALGALARIGTGLNLAGQFTYRTWSGANSDLLEQGGAGARNTVELKGGLEWLPDPRRPWWRPLRIGARYAELPFLLEGVADQPHEFGITIGSGARFAAQRGGIDVALERVWRSAGDPYHESGWHLVIGVSLRPALSQP